MAKIVLYMWMSLDGFVTGLEDEPGRPLGIGGERLHDTLAIDGVDPSTVRGSDEVATAVLEEVMATGAVLVGRRTFDLAGRWNGDHHDGVPIVVLTRARPTEPAPGHAHYVDDVREAARQAREAAGDRDVLLHGADAAQACLRAGVVDEIALQVVPVLLGQGRRLFDHLAPDHVELELVRTLEGARTLHLRYRVLR